MNKTKGWFPAALGLNPKIKPTNSKVKKQRDQNQKGMTHESKINKKRNLTLIQSMATAGHHNPLSLQITVPTFDDSRFQKIF
ncbi:hypothetical protein V6Z12_D12G135300 [Gossypium hirsutum]